MRHIGDWCNGSTGVFEALGRSSNLLSPAIKREVDVMSTKVCSKCNKELPFSDFHKNGFSSNGEQKYRGYCKKCASKKESERYRLKREYVNKQKIACQKCGETRFYTLDFHHKDAKVKDFTIGRFKRGNLQTIQNEIDKCIVLCSNCHREFHYLFSGTGITLEEYLNSQQ